MTSTRFTTDPAALAAMKKANRDAKKAIQAKRSRDAKTNASMKKIPHHHFPTYYKYG